MPVRIDVRHVGRSENRPIPIGNGLRFVKRNIISFNFRKKVNHVNTNFVSSFFLVHSVRVVPWNRRRNTFSYANRCSINR